jgi:hypothetical protein
VFFEQTRTLFNAAYNTFAVAADHDNYDPDDTARWQSAADFVSSGLKIGEDIADGAYRLIYEAEMRIAQRRMSGLLRVEGTDPKACRRDASAASSERESCLA